MYEWFDNGVLGAISAALCVMYFYHAVGFSILTWRYRKRFMDWQAFRIIDRFDAVMNISLSGFFMIMFFRHIGVIQAFTTQQWRATPFAIWLAIWFTPPTLLFLSGTFAWLCHEVFKHPPRWWQGWVAGISGAAVLALYISWRF